MECPYCKSIDIRDLKVHILRPIGATKHKCLQCNQSFIRNKTDNNLISIPHENKMT